VTGRPCLIVFGAGGQLGRALLSLASPPDWDLRTFCHSQLEITDEGAVVGALRGIDSGLVVNLAAYTNVDLAETEAELAFAVNAYGAGVVAAAAAEKNLPIIQLSTDYVFAGNAVIPYDENAETSPISVYGQSKLAGEKAAMAANPRHVILRTSWLFSGWGRNFWRSIILQAQNIRELKVVDDQIGCPTPAMDLAKIIITIAPGLAAAQAGGPEFGIFHACGSEPVSWFGFAQAILEHLPSEDRPLLIPISSLELSRPARRPAYSALDCGKLVGQFGLQAPSWRLALDNLKLADAQ
jgi:dTDP-4-dehydrorhamnose reductase